MLKTYIAEKKLALDVYMSGLLKELSYPNVIAEGMEYSVMNGGKRVRPLLLFMTLELLGKNWKLGLPTGSAIEFIHSYSLVHDDLPALDNDDYRRGKLTTHKKYGEAEAILIGDALLTHAFNILTEKNVDILNPFQIVDLIKFTSKYAGIGGMIGGQMVDIESEGKKVDMETLKYIHSNKTGKLLKLPVEAACIIGETSVKTRKILEKYAELIGLAFQIKDDILDIEGDFEKLGKPVGSDESLDKSTYPALIGLDESKKLLEEVIAEAIEIIKENFGEEKGKYLIALASYIGKRES
jgi:geranylgeranyl diphosphate synthase type II